MVAYLRERAPEAKELIVGSNDAQRFVGPLQELASDGIAITVLGFVEFAGALAGTPSLTFVDLEDIPELLTVRLERIRLDNLPEEGQWFEPRISPEEALELARQPSR